MTQPMPPAGQQLPSLRQLRSATLVAIAVAATLFVTTVLPAEYGRDPTGIGQLLGLTPMGLAKQHDDAVRKGDHAPVPTWRFALVSSALAQSTAPAQAGTPVPPTAQSPRKDEISVTLKPSESVEVKAFMKVGDEIAYSWKTTGGKLNYEFHGEPLNAPSNVYTSYGKGSADKVDGTFRPKFDGTHGWFWRNRTSQTITVTVATSGRYEKLERVK